jgi:hypothetical protein
MRSLISWVSRLRIDRRGRRDAEIHDELAFHLEMQEKLERDRGASPDEARRRAQPVRRRRRHDGGVPGSARAAGLDQLRQDSFYAIRMFARIPASASSALLTLAIGIGATVTIFSLLEGVLPPAAVSRPRAPGRVRNDAT